MAKEIYLYSPIYDFVAESLLSQIEDNMGSRVKLRVNSPGGNVTSGYGICAKVEEHGDVLMQVDGSAMSMAFDMLLYAKRVECLDVSSFMFHRASSYSTDPSIVAWLAKINKDLRAKLEDKVDPVLFEKVAGVSIEKIFTDEKIIDVYLDANQMKKLGLVQKINVLTVSEVTAFNEKMLEKPITAIELTEIIQTPKKMTKEELKAAHPQAYAEILQMGVEAERDRVGAWTAFASIDMAAVTEGIKSGKLPTATTISEMAVKAMSPLKIEAVAASAPGSTTTAAADGKETPTAEAKALADFEAEVNGHLKLSK